jgi:SAM-dependent methyltransferase/UDP-N-acetylglucosamine transferase subunit ALG13
MDVLVTVGMGRWPFDRLVSAAGLLHPEHEVFVQTGASTVRPPCPHAPFVRADELKRRIAQADVVVTHAGNTVRLVQREGKVPIVVPRIAARGEMGNDHHAEFLSVEARSGRVAAVWDVAELPRAVRTHRDTERRLLSERPAPPPPDPERVVRTLEEAWQRAAGNPFARDPLRRYAYAWDRLASRIGRHLDVGFGDGRFLAGLAATTKLECHGVEPHAGRFASVARVYPQLALSRIAPGAPLPFADCWFDSVSLLDVLEHCPDPRDTLAEVHRVLRPEGVLVLTVPARHALSWLDPDDIKLRFPRLHRRLYTLRFGKDVYEQGFGERGDGLFGDMSRGLARHTNFEPQALARQISGAGLEITDRAGANLLWRLLPPPQLVPEGSTRRLVERVTFLDGRLFSRANLFLTTRKPT